ncbi:YqjF family protein [Mycolicibacterium sp.]|uniref:YqjF family protein n=1 Tax=Mycolicibacterium sp. TaxID=2320850 RepID=UPI0037C5FDF0
MSPQGSDPLAGYPVAAPPLRGRVWFDQSWLDLTFVHWPVRPADVAHLYPAGSRPDVFSADGMTYVGLVPFRMGHTKVGAGPAMPYFGAFAETNVRLYSVDDAGRHGVLFRSLETARLAVVPAIRATMGIPYTWARMRITRTPEVITYDSVRRWPQRGLRSRVAVRPGGTVEPTALETWLTARWGAHTRKAGRTWWVPNQHEPWPLQSAQVVDFDDELVAAAGVRTAGEPLRVLYSRSMRTQFGRPIVVA